jgi:hypothetical protein
LQDVTEKARNIMEKEKISVDQELFLPKKLEAQDKALEM